MNHNSGAVKLMLTNSLTIKSQILSPDNNSTDPLYDNFINLTC